jgi:hypothetical protein
VTQLQQVLKKKRNIHCLPDLNEDVFRPSRRCNRSSYRSERRAFEVCSKAAGLKKRHIDAANVPTHPMKEEDVHAGLVLMSHGMDVGAPLPEYYGQRLYSALKRAEISTSLAGEARTSRLEID